MIELLFILGGGAGIANFTLTKQLWAALDTPRLATGHVVIGQVEVCGAAASKPGSPIVTSPLGGSQCVWWDVFVEEEVGSGKAAKWIPRFRVSTQPWIHIDDGTGPVLTNVPKTAHVAERTYTSFLETMPARVGYLQLARSASGLRGSKLYSRIPYDEDSLFDPALVQRFEIVDEGTPLSDQPIAEFAGKWKITERYVELGAQLYVIGSTTYDNASRGARFEPRQKRPLFMRLGAEEDYVNGLQWRVRIYAGLLIIAMFFAPAVWLGGNEPGDRTPHWLAGFVSLGLLSVWWFVGRIIRVRNRISATKEQVRSGAGLVDIAIQKRAELIPSLVAVVQAATSHSEEVLTKLLSLRNQRANGDEALNELQALARKHPKLGTAANYQQLHHSLAAVEMDLAVAHGFVVDAEAIHQTRIQTFPDSLIAWFFRLR